MATKKIDVLTIVLDHQWYKENPGYATFADWVGEFLANKFGDHYRMSELTHYEVKDDGPPQVSS